MTSNDAAERVVEELKQYFSTPIARALLTSTLRRAKLAPDFPVGSIPDVIAAIERTLPMYIADAVRRGECVGRLRRLAHAAPAHGAPPTTSGAGGASTAIPLAARRLGANPASATSTVVQVRTADDVANACEVGRDLARRVGFVHVEQTKIATAIAELGRNIILYAELGAVHIAGIEAPRRGVEVLAVDEGPGISDIELVMVGNYRSRTGMGMGLRGAKRLMDSFEIESSPKGTTVLTRKFVT